MKSPIDGQVFSKFIEESDVFALTRDAMMQCLTNWYREDKAQFKQDMRADLDTVMQTYCFHNSMVSLNKNFRFDPPMDTVSCTIDINDAEDDYCAWYRAIFDSNLKIIDDVLSK